MQHKTTISIQAETHQDTIQAIRGLLDMIQNPDLLEQHAQELMDGTFVVNAPSYQAEINHMEQEEAKPASNKTIIEAHNKYLSFKGNTKQAITFVDRMREYALDNLMTDFLFNIEVALQDMGIYDEHFNLIDTKPKGFLTGGAK